jgi:hypothetical protein
MIPVQTTIVQHDEIPALEEIEFGIGDPRAVMQANADLYSDISTAIVREYSTNAYDAHVMAGHTDPIEVTLPSVMSPEFVVRDHGVGMSIDQWRQNYTQFGVSDKRLRRDVNGQLGYGSKSGVAYTTSFQVTSVQNGVKNVGIVVRKPDWSIVLKVVSTERTDEPNGTEIRVPVHNVEEFAAKAHAFYRTWLPGRVLVNGKAPEFFAGTKIVENLYYSEEWGKSYVVLGNVPYRINNPDALFRSTKMNRINFVAYVDDLKTIDGAAPIEFTPSREDLKYTQRTLDTLQAIVDNMEANIVKVAQDEIDNATDHFDAYTKWVEWTNRLGRALFDSLEFNGDKFEAKFPISGFKYNAGRSRNSTGRIDEWDVANMATTMVVTEFNQAVSTSVKAKAREYRALKGWAGNVVLFTHQRASEINSPWIRKTQFVTWADLKAALPKKPRNSGGMYGGRIPGSFDYFTSNGTTYESELPEVDGQLFYISVQDSKNINAWQVLNHLKLDDDVVILLPANRIAKFKRDNPQVIDFATWVQKKVVRRAADLLSDEAKEALSVSSDLVRWLDQLDTDAVDDPEFARIKGLRADLKNLTKAMDANQTLANMVGMRYNVDQYAPTTTHFGLLKKYPLLKEYSGYYYRNITPTVAKEIVIYINAKYAAASQS